eukprot:215760-Prymnesium_polylepis.3
MGRAAGLLPGGAGSPHPGVGRHGMLAGALLVCAPLAPTTTHSADIDRGGQHGGQSRWLRRPLLSGCGARSPRSEVPRGICAGAMPDPFCVGALAPWGALSARVARHGSSGAAAAH